MNKHKLSLLFISLIICSSIASTGLTPQAMTEKEGNHSTSSETNFVNNRKRTVEPRFSEEFQGTDLDALDSIETKNLLSENTPSKAYDTDESSTDHHPVIKTTTEETPPSLKFNPVKLTVNDTPALLQIYYEDSNGDITTYGHAGEEITVNFLIKGIANTGDIVEITFRRDIVNSFDSNLAVGTYEFTEDLPATEYIHLTWTVTLDANQDDFGYGTGDIRSYFLKVSLDSYGMLFDGSDTDDYRLFMVGYLTLYSVQYYNYTTEGEWVPISHAVTGWNILVTFYVAVLNGPIWDFDIQGTMKADVKWGIDETLFSDDKKTISGTIDPGIYYYNWSDIDGVPYYFEVPSDRSYGNNPGDTRNLFGTIFMNDNEIDATNPDNPRDELYILPNTEAQPPSVHFELPTDGYVTYNQTLTLAVDVDDPNSNYEITSVQVLTEGDWLDVSDLYNPLTGRLDIIVNNAFTQSGIQNVTVKAIDLNGNMGYDSVLIQYFSHGYFFPDNYNVTNKKSNLDIFTEDFTYAHLFRWEKDDLAANVTPYFSVEVAAEVEYELLTAFPSDLEPGEEFSTYLKFINPQITLTLTLELGADYVFEADSNFYEGHATLYQKIIRKSLPISFGIFRIDLREISDEVESMSHFDIETKDFLPSLISWLANFRLDVDFIPIIKLKNLLNFDIDTTNCDSKFDSLTISTDSLYVLPCTASSTASGADDATIELTNFEIAAAMGVEAYCQLTFSGKLLFTQIGPIDVNAWMYEHFGIEIPYLDLWLLGINIPLTGSELIVIPLNPIPLDIHVSDISYTGQNISISLRLTDSKDNLISGADITITYDNKELTVEDQGNGIYTLSVKYNPETTEISVSATKLGYIDISTEFELSINTDEFNTDEGGYTFLTISLLTVLAFSALVILKRKRSKI